MPANAQPCRLLQIRPVVLTLYLGTARGVSLVACELTALLPESVEFPRRGGVLQVHLFLALAGGSSPRVRYGLPLLYSLREASRAVVACCLCEPHLWTTVRQKTLTATICVSFCGHRIMQHPWDQTAPCPKSQNAHITRGRAREIDL